jgi:hypothetical protein
MSAIFPERKAETCKFYPPVHSTFFKLLSYRFLLVENMGYHTGFISEQIGRKNLQVEIAAGKSIFIKKISPGKKCFL